MARPISKFTQHDFTSLSGLPSNTATFLFEYYQDETPNMLKERAQNLRHVFQFNRIVIAGLDKFDFNPGVQGIRTINIPGTIDASPKRAWLFVHPTLDFVVAGHDYYGEVTFRNPALIPEAHIWFQDNASWEDFDYGRSQYCAPIYARFF